MKAVLKMIRMVKNRVLSLKRQCIHEGLVLKRDGQSESVPLAKENASFTSSYFIFRLIPFSRHQIDRIKIRNFGTVLVHFWYTFYSNLSVISCSPSNSNGSFKFTFVVSPVRYSTFDIRFVN